MWGRKLVSKENILSKISVYDIFKKYVNNFDDIHKLFKSELRTDKKPTCVIYKSGNNLQYKDFGVPGTLSCFDYIKEKYGVTYYEALDIVNSDFNLNFIPNTSIKHIPSTSIIHNINIKDLPDKEVIINVEIREWNRLDKKYWKDKYEITSKDLKKFNVYALKSFWINGMHFIADSLCYGYYLGLNELGEEQWKIYQPYSKKCKWISNYSTTSIQGLNQLPDAGEFLIITKSLKDIIILSKIGIPAIAPQGESSYLSEDLILELKERFKVIIFLYDNDIPGVNNALRNQNLYDIQAHFLPLCTKDVSDYTEKYSLEQLQIYINYLYELSCYNTRMGITLYTV